MKTISLTLTCLLLTSQSFADVCSKENEVWNGTKCITVGVSAAATAAQAAKLFTDETQSMKGILEYRANLAVYNDLVSGGNPAAINLYQYTGKASQTGFEPSAFLNRVKNGDRVIVVYSNVAPSEFRKSREFIIARGSRIDFHKLEERISNSLRRLDTQGYDARLVHRYDIYGSIGLTPQARAQALADLRTEQLPHLANDTKVSALNKRLHDVSRQASRLERAKQDQNYPNNARKFPVQERVFTVSDPSEVQGFLQQVKQTGTIVSVTRVPASKIADANAILKKGGIKNAKNLAGVFLAGVLTLEEIAFGQVAKSLGNPSTYRPEFSSTLNARATAK